MFTWSVNNCTWFFLTETDIFGIIETIFPTNIISSIDSSAVSVVVLFEGAEFCGKIIPKPEPNSGKSVSYKVSEDIGFIIDNDKISDIGIQRGGRY